MSDTRCNKCAKLILDVYGNNLAAVRVYDLDLIREKTSNDRDVARQLGKYDAKKTYSLCWECYLEALGIAP